MAEPASSFVQSVENALAPLADPAKAKPMAAYMKNRFAFLGIKTPDRRAVTKALIRNQQEALISSAETLWAMPFREYQYVACDLLDRHASALPRSALSPVLKLVTQKSWWDTVDSLAKVAGMLARIHRALIPRMEKLASDRNMWLRRVAILHQLGAKGETDADRLFHICLANAADPEFFIRKAIGWALRDYARHDAHAVRHFLNAHSDTFSALTNREAGKHI